MSVHGSPDEAVHPSLHYSELGCGFPGLEGENAIHHPSPLHDFADRGEIFLNEPLPAADKAPCFLVSKPETLSLFSLAVC